MCGFIGVIGVPQAAREVFIALQTVQHRGQDSAGIYTKSGAHFMVRKGMGNVPHAIPEEELEQLSGRVALGHVRYPTFGRAVEEDCQPFFYRQPGVLMAHNGNITNYDRLRSVLQESSIHLLSTCDVEPVLCLFSDTLMAIRPKNHTMNDAIVAFRKVQREVKGAYTIAGVAELDGEDTMFMCRDPQGIRPGVWGRRGTGFMVTSESVALDALGFEFAGEIGPGEMIFFREGQEPIHVEGHTAETPAPCVFEHIYFARPDSIIDGKTVYEVRLDLGRRLAEEWRERELEVDTVIPIPDTSRPAATALSEALGIPMREGFIKNRYSGRTFIMPSQTSRTAALRLKLNPIRSEIEGRRVLLVDDSIVRGNTVRSIIALVRAMKPKEVHLAIFSPPVTDPCYYGIDMSRREELVAQRYLKGEPGHTLNLERQREFEMLLAKELDLDSLTYLSQDGLDAVATWPKCAACFTGRYPQPLSTDEQAYIEVNRDNADVQPTS